MRLDSANLDRLPAAVARFGYHRAAMANGIVHFGIGAFHRAHMAWYTDRAMDAGDRDWLITGVSMRSSDVAARLNPQDGLYTLIERDGTGTRARLLGAISRVLVAPQAPASVVAALAAPGTRIASFTITEKAYCRAADGSLEPALAGNGSIYPLLASGLAARRAAGLGGVALMSCDNIADNGRVLRRLLLSWLSAHDPACADWVAQRCSFPSTMVDRIVPATTPADLEMAAALIGMTDAGAVVTEPFSQWVVEDDFAAGRPDWEAMGAELVADVAPYEQAKLRMLNGAHSALAYLGLERGHTHVHEAIADPLLRALVLRLMLDEAAPTVSCAPGQDLQAYADMLLARFENPALAHRLTQIAMDGSQKIPQRWLATLEANRMCSRDCPAIMAALAAWLRHVRGDNEHRAGLLADPRADSLQSLWDGGTAHDVVNGLFGADGLLAGHWLPSPATMTKLAQSAIAGPAMIDSVP